MAWAVGAREGERLNAFIVGFLLCGVALDGNRLLFGCRAILLFLGLDVVLTKRIVSSLIRWTISIVILLHDHLRGRATNWRQGRYARFLLFSWTLCRLMEEVNLAW